MTTILLFRYDSVFQRVLRVLYYHILKFNLSHVTHIVTVSELTINLRRGEESCYLTVMIRNLSRKRWRTHAPTLEG